MIIRPQHILRSVLLLTALLTLSACSSRNPVENGGGAGSDSPNIDTTGNSANNAGGGGSIGSPGYDIRDTSLVYAYRRNSPFADVLKDCVLIGSDFELSCKLSTLPFIGDGINQPTIEDVMNRVLVTHDWMGERFEQVLREAPSEVMTMFSSATAVLIGSEVRPSFYQATHGAIQLDPVYLWSSVDEKSSVSIAPDFRSDFGADLQFWFIGSHRNRNGNRLTPFYSLEDDSVRPVEDVTVPLIRLLAHELTHATDFMPRSKIAGLDPNLSVYDAIISVYDDWLSRQLTFDYPLNSEELKGFAEYRYTTAGNERGATNAQKAATAADVGEFMGSDGAIQFYSYSTIREDLAQLTESVIMSYRYDSITNIGFAQKPANEDSYTCDELVMSWGRRNRLADPLVNIRARRAADLVLSLTPELVAYLDDSLGAPEAMETNVSWCDNQQLTAQTIAASQPRSASSVNALQAGDRFRSMIKEMRLGAHHGPYLP